MGYVCREVDNKLKRPGEWEPGSGHILTQMAVLSAHPRENGMDCCGQGHTLAPRHWMCGSALTSVAAMLACDLGPRGSTAAAHTAETAPAALDVLRKAISADVQTHGAPPGVTSTAPTDHHL